MRKILVITLKTLWSCRDLIVTALMTFIASVAVIYEISLDRALLLGSLVFILQLLLRGLKIPNLRATSQKRFTFLKDGNPSIKEGDLPEIIEFLYRLEEESNE